MKLASLKVVPRLSARRLSTASSVDLDYAEYFPSNGNKTDQPLLILHGLFGSKRNWTSLSKAFSRDLNRPVYAVDLRNHGTSPYKRPMTYSSMAEDVLHFIHKHSLTNVSLLGHSMGGKVAMTVALDPSLKPSMLSNLIVADIAPSKGQLNKEFLSYIEAMKKINDAQVQTRKEALQILHEYEKDPAVCAFLFTNLIVPHNGVPEHVRFRIPVDILGDSIRDLGNFPYEPGERTWAGDTLFIKGQRSAFINRHNIPTAEKFFPNMNLQTLDTNHWVHAERPDEFKNMTVKFILNRS